MSAEAPPGAFTADELALLDGLATPAQVQAFLDATPYSTDPFYRSPRRVIAERRAHCVDGALFAAAALERQGHAPRVVDLRAVRDDDHVIAVFQVGRCWGAVAKSNTVGLRFREPVYRSLRELAMSYFDVYYNLEAEKTLREVSVPLDLRVYDHLRWRTEDEGIEPFVCERLATIRHTRLLTPAQEAALVPVDKRLFDGCLHGADWDGLWKNPPGSDRADG